MLDADPLLRLKRRTLLLGNQHRKYLYTISEHLDGLYQRLESHGAVERIHLWSRAPSYRDQMAEIGQWGKSEEEKLADLGCYFALQFLHMKLNALDGLAIELHHGDRLQTFKQFMLNIGHEFRRLTAAYMDELMKIFLPDSKSQEYVIMGVGTRSDQDDIDLGIVDRGTQGRDELTAAIARMNTEMLKKAISTHYHLSEHVCNNDSFAASISDYEDLLTSEIHDFVIINEMLGAARIIGSRRLFFEFREQVAVRYYYDRNKPENWKFHEGYLRGIVGEARSFALREFARDHLNPKVDGLRMIKASLYAAKTMFHLRQVNAWALLESLKYHDPSRRQAYDALEQALTLLEVFRYLYQLLVAEEEEIYYEDPATRSNMNIVAEAMGYRRIGAASAVDFLIADYYHHARTAKEQILHLLPDVAGHIASISSFQQFKKNPAEGLANRFWQALQFFRGTRFWDDVMVLLQQDDAALLKAVIRDIEVRGEGGSDLVRQWVDWGQNSYLILFPLMTMLYRQTDGRLGEAMMEEFLQRELSVDQVQRISVVYNRQPEMLVRLIHCMSESHRRRFYELLQIHIWDQQSARHRDQLATVVKLHFITSKYVRRILEKVITTHPDFLAMVNDPAALTAYGKGLLSQVDYIIGFAEQRKKLTEFHDFEFLRVSLLALSKALNQQVAEEYIEFSDAYLQYLFKICKLEIDAGHPPYKPDRSRLSILVTGGYGHCLAFDDDYDLIILVDTEAPEVKAYYEAILARMHTEIARLGVLPHYRLAEYTGSFICTIGELKRLLQNHELDTFVDQSQLLGARMVIGSRHLQTAFYDYIIRPHIFSQKLAYSMAMLDEIRHRREIFDTAGNSTISLKESPGGLRDIEMILDILRALFEVPQNSNYKVFHVLQTILPDSGRLLHVLQQQYDFLRTIRNIHRLAIAADDLLNLEYLDLLAEVLDGSERNQNTVPLLERIKGSMELVRSIHQELVEEVIAAKLEDLEDGC
jgi:hypothetical protein